MYSMKIQQLMATEKLAGFVMLSKLVRVEIRNRLIWSQPIWDRLMEIDRQLIKSQPKAS